MYSAGCCQRLRFEARQSRYARVENESKTQAGIFVSAKVITTCLSSLMSQTIPRDQLLISGLSDGSSIRWPKTYANGWDASLMYPPWFT